jgi:hypothetical protein
LACQSQLRSQEAFPGPQQQVRHGRA